MIHLILAIASSTLISILMRAGEDQIKNNMVMFAANYAVCLCFSAGYLLLGNGSLIRMDSFAVFMGILSGILYLASFMFLQFNIRKNGVILAATFMKLGVIVPTVMAMVVFRELPGRFQVVGILLAVAAIILINVPLGTKNEQEQKKYYGGYLILLLLMGGFTDSLANIFDKCGNDATKDGYLLFTFGMAFLLSILVGFMKKQSITKTDILWGIAIGVPNYYSARFLLLALGDLSAIIVYPVYNVATILLIAASGKIWFREKIGTQKMFGLLLILVSLVLLNLTAA